MHILVRRATREDLPWVLGELEKFSGLVASRIPLYNAENAPAIAGDLIDKHIFFVAESQGRPLGFIVGALMPHFLNHAIRHLGEIFWWVSEEYRGTRAGGLLLRAFDEFGEGNADWVTMSLFEVSPIDDACLTARGYKKFESSYLREVA